MWSKRLITNQENNKAFGIVEKLRKFDIKVKCYQKKSEKNSQKNVTQQRKSLPNKWISS